MPVISVVRIRKTLARVIAAGVVLGLDAQTPAFEVATVKINTSGAARPGHTVVPQSGQVTITNITVSALIQEAYDVQLPSLIVDMPEWARTQRVDVVAKAASPAPVPVLQRMLEAAAGGALQAGSPPRSA